MSINGIGNYQISANALYAAQNVNPVDSSGDADRSRVTAPTTNGRSGLFSSAITQTLFQIGVTPAAANVATGAAPTNTQQQAVNAFAQNLFAALQPGATPSSGGTGTKGSVSSKKDIKPTEQTQSADDTDAAASISSSIQAGASSAGAVVANGGNLENRLQGLIQRLASTSGNPQGNESQGDLSALQQSYQNLLSTQGGGGSGVTLGNFLQTLAQNLQDLPPSGSLISTSA